MARTEGRSQPDLLNFLRRSRGTPHPAPPSSPPPAPGAAKSLHPVLAGSPPARQGVRGSSSRRDLLLVAALVLLVLGIAGALLVQRLLFPSTPTSSAKEPGAATGKVGPAKTPASALSVFVPGSGPKASTFNTLVVAGYPLAKEAEARKACEHLRAKGKEFSDLFLYRGAKQVLVCLGRYESTRNPQRNDALAKLAGRVGQMPGPSGGRDFKDCHFSLLTIAQP